ncbi:MAG: PhzF family phenazine biosynthesis protein [Bacteroidales bacterium]|jgi:predicted PhzF superfamily epimerase YddE/YHI9|nr:PhzF family phenazine biosynthesis protein [Bacteroidales bacterium]MDD3735614.1 PhzF family phenazine biosynthesis protein [Bacteroidales bacterium]HNT92540.1 PhzF family phenazine biosynthesis protein [Bacteroidales bacterium]HOO66804.1 PhzF family phenazine biosynthesis protein [Bacteroidales bacterium]HPJ05515.1 PhzF family phenazine biosynthesis protein [Bacteroidales bacterium]
MMIIPFYQVDAFTHGPFTGNPAAVCVLTEPVTVETMQKIAMENNLSETAFITKGKDEWLIRWFTPAAEVDLCGHATLASAFVVLNILDPQSEEVRFLSRVMGHLTVRKRGDLLELDFPVDTLSKCELPGIMAESLGSVPAECLMGRTDYLLLYGSETEIINMKPDFRTLAGTGARGVIVTAPGDTVDFVSRCFFPQIGIDEDPVTGSAHTTLTPFWSARIGKKTMKARQLSARGGVLECTLDGDRVHIAGSAILYLKGEIYV